MIMTIRECYEELGLDFDAVLSRLINERLVQKFALKFLDDPQKQYGDAEHIQIMATKGFSDKDPYAAAFFRNFALDNDQLSELMDLVEAYPMHEEEGAKIWLSEHPEVNEFFPTFAEE